MFKMWYNVFITVVYINSEHNDIYLDLHLALFSAHSSFPLDLRSFWLFTLTWTRKRALVFWPTGIYAFFPGIYAYCPGKYAHNFGFKMHKVQKCQEWCNCARVGENRSKGRNLSNEHLFVLFRGYRYVINENAYDQRVRLSVIFIFYWYQWHKFNTQYYVYTTYVCMYVCM